MAYIVIEIQDPGSEAYWTLLDATGGGDLREEYKFISKQRAEEMADTLNGVEPGQVGPNE